MKKKIIYILAILFSMFYFKPNVSAYSTSFDSSYLGSIDITDSYSSLYSNSVITNTYNEFKTWFDSQSIYTYYYFFIYTNSSSIDSSNIFLFTSYEESNEFFMWVRSFSQDVNTSYFRIETNNPPTTYYRVDIPYNYNFNSSNVYGPLTSPSDNVISSSANKIILYDSNTPLNLGSYNLSNTFMLKLGNYYYGNRDILPSVLSGQSEPSIKLSTVNLTDSNDNIVGYDLYINWNLKDNNKYLYQYKLNSSSDWVSFNTDLRVDVLHIFENSSYNFRIVDKSNNDVVSRAAITFTSLKNNDEENQKSTTIRIIDNHCLTYQEYISQVGSSGGGHSSGSGRHDDGSPGNYLIPNEAVFQVQFFTYDLEQNTAYYSFDDNNYIKIDEFIETEYENIYVYNLNIETDTHVYIKVYNNNSEEPVQTLDYYFTYTCGESIYSMDDLFKKSDEYVKTMSPLFLMFSDILNFAYNSVNNDIKLFIVFIFILLISANLINRMRK